MLFFIIIVSIFAEVHAQNIYGKELMLEKVLEKGFYSRPYDFYLVNGNYYMINWMEGFIVRDDGYKKKFTLDSTKVRGIKGSARISNFLIISYSDPSNSYYVVRYDFLNDSIKQQSHPDEKDLLATISQLYTEKNGLFIDDGIVFNYLFGGAFIITSSDTYKISSNSFYWTKRVFLVGDTMLVAINAARDWVGYTIFATYTIIKKDTTKIFLDEPAGDYMTDANGYIFGNRIFIAGNGVLYVFSLPEFNLLFKRSFGYLAQNGDIIIVNGNGYIVFSDEDRGNFAILYKFDPTNFSVKDSIMFSGHYWCGFKYYDNVGLFFVMYDGKVGKTTVYKIKDKVTNVTKEPQIPQKFALYQNYPNPFNPTTTISYDLPERAHVKLTVYNILGQEVATLVNAEQEPGRYNVNFNASDLPSGVYFYRLEAGNFIEQKKMILIK
jgi:hypothetical protein